MTERQRTETENQLQILSRAISEAPDFHTALSIALLQVCKATNWDYGEAWIPGKNGSFLELSPVWHSNTRLGRATMSALEQFRLCSEDFILTPATGLPGRVWSSQQPEWITDVSAHSETYFLRNQIAKACGIKAGFGVPILANHHVLAVLVFFILEARAEDKQLVELVTSVTTALGEVFQYLNAVEASQLSRHS